MSTRALLLGCAMLLATLTGCGSTPRIDAERQAPTGIEPGEAVTIILGTHQECKDHVNGGCPASSLAESSEKEFESCLSAAIESATPDFTIVPAATFRSTALPGAAFEHFPRTAEALAAAAKDEDFRRRVAPLKLRYAVVLTVITRESGRRTTHGGSQGVWEVGRQSVRSTSMTAEILDLREARISGALRANSQGAAGWTVPVVLFVPLPPIPYSAVTETKACDSLGKPVANFIRIRNSWPMRN